jgi:hypothetical protein
MASSKDSLWPQFYIPSGDLVVPPLNPMFAVPVASSGRSGNHLISVDTGEIYPSPSPVPKKSSATMILLAWLLVGVPLGWGPYNTLLSSMALFQRH